MINNLKIQNKIEQTALINSKIYSLKKLGVIKQINISPFTKKILLFSGILINIIKEIILKLFYFYMIYFIIKLFCGKYDTNIFVISFIYLTIFGSLINSKILKTSQTKYNSVILLNMDCKDYTMGEVISNIIFQFIFQFVSILFLSNLLKISIKLNILLCIYLVLIKIIGEGFNIFYYNKNKHTFLNNTFLYFLSLIVLLSLIFITSKLHIYISVSNLTIINIILFIISIISLIYILTIKDYKTIYKRVINYSQHNESSISKEELYSINNEYSKTIDRTKYKSPYKYFNSIFIKRHKHILVKPILTETIFILIVGVVALISVIMNKNISNMVGTIITKYFMWIFLIIYMLNKTSQMTQAMFINCDRSLLTYDFYKEKTVIINIFKERCLSLITINLLPISVLSIFISVLLYITININIYNILLIFITLITTSVLFTIHFLSLYYLIQPYDTSSRIVDLKYQIINFILVAALFIIIKIKISLTILSIIITTLSILYSVVNIILVNKKVGNTFKIK